MVEPIAGSAVSTVAWNARVRPVGAALAAPAVAQSRPRLATAASSAFHAKRVVRMGYSYPSSRLVVSYLNFTLFYRCRVMPEQERPISKKESEERIDAAEPHQSAPRSLFSRWGA